MKIRTMKTVGRGRTYNSLQIGVALDWEKHEICLYLFFLCWGLIIQLRKPKET